MKSWTLPVQQREDGEFYIELNDEILKDSGFEIGDALKWTDLKNGSYSLTKESEDIYIVSAVSIFSLKFAVRARSAEHAMDTVVCDDGTVKELSQKHITIDVVDAVKATEEQYLETFDRDNDYMRSWTKEQKLNMINKVDYENSK
jgi:hypothetical protein